jgi:hypothetical protein
LETLSRENLMWWLHTLRKDVKAIVLAVALVAALAIAWIKFGSSGGTAVKNNFGPDWNCVNPGEGDSVCIKKVKPDQEAH